MKYKHGDLASMASPSTTIAMADGDGSPRVARTLKIKSSGVRWCSNRSPPATFGFLVPSLRSSIERAPLHHRGDVAVEPEPGWLHNRSLTWGAIGHRSSLGRSSNWVVLRYCAEMESAKSEVFPAGPPLDGLRYPAMERTCCALVWAAKRLKQYMSHTTWLVAKIDPIKYIFEKPALTRQIARWQMALSEYNI
ncbi:hypothetical protein CR513_10401, partial [Mucuna pruriens]